MSNLTVLHAYRGLLREIGKASPSRKGAVFKAPAHSLRLVFASNQSSSSKSFLQDIGSAQTFITAQREYGELLTRYNPLHDLTAEEHLTATVNRVGLSMPKDVDLESDSTTGSNDDPNSNSNPVR